MCMQMLGIVQSGNRHNAFRAIQHVSLFFFGVERGFVISAKIFLAKRQKNEHAAKYLTTIYKRDVSRASSRYWHFVDVAQVEQRLHSPLS